MHICSRNQVKCPTCEEFCCVRCHTQGGNCSPKNNEQEITIRCKDCAHEQVTKSGEKVSCNLCGKAFGYVCTICYLVKSMDLQFDYYHCEECGFCRKASKGVKFTHCKGCQCDMPEGHRCYQNDSCPICLEVC